VRKQRPHACGAGWYVLARLVLERYRWRLAVARSHLRARWFVRYRGAA
jgi:hypothetical protein